MTDRRTAGKVSYGEVTLRPETYKHGQRYYRYQGWQVEREGQGPRAGAPFLWAVYHPPTHGLFPITRVSTLKEAARYIDANALEILGDDFDPDAEWHSYLDDSALDEKWWLQAAFIAERKEAQDAN